MHRMCAGVVRRTLSRMPYRLPITTSVRYPEDLWEVPVERVMLAIEYENHHRRRQCRKWK